MRKLKKYVSIILIISTALAMLCSVTAKGNDVVLNEKPEATEQQEKVFPDIISEAEITEKGYVYRERELEENLNTVVLKNSDGTYTLRLFDFPVKYVDDSGDIKDISLSLSKDNDGSYRSYQHKTDIRLSKKLCDGISLEYENIDLVLKPEVNNSTQAEEINERTITYKIDENTSYEYSLTCAGFKEDIVVKEYTGQTDYYFILETNGLSIKKLEGSFYLVDGYENIKANIGDIIIFTADEKNNALGNITVSTIEENEKYQLTIHIDDSYLCDEKTKYPIRIDPTIEIAYNGTSDAGKIEDITLNSNSTSDGSSGSLYVGKRQTFGISRVLMKFPGLSFPTAISSYSQILSADVEMRDLLCETMSMYIYVHRFTGNTWTETDPNVGWNTVNPNSYITNALDYKIVSYSNGVDLNPAHRYKFNITEAVKMWVVSPTDKNKGIIFRSEYIIEEGGTYSNKTFASYNRATNKPSLSVKFTAIIPKRVYKIRNVFLYQYLTAVDKDTLKTSSLVVDENGNAKDGKQLWYADADASGITLYSMGIKDLDSYGANEMVLGGYLNNYSPKIKPEGSSATKWELELTFFNNNYYNVKNISADNYMVGTSANGTVTSSATTTVYSYWVFEEIERSTFNNYFTGTYNGMGNKLNIKISLDSSIYTSGLANEIDYDVVKVWNGISSKVVIYGPNDTAPTNCINVSIIADNLQYVFPEDIHARYAVGYTYGYKMINGNKIRAEFNESFDGADIYINSAYLSVLLGDSEMIESIVIHEMGHVLKLCHPKEEYGLPVFDGARNGYNDDNSVCSVMNHAVGENLFCIRPKIHDIINLINKWGE